jgi:hypothetical protein
MKKVLLVIVLLSILSSFLFAQESIKKEDKITFKEIIGLIFFLFFFLVLIFIGNLFLYSGRSASGSIRLTNNNTLNLKLREMFDTEENEINLKFIIKKVIGNNITLQCQICEGTRKILTKTIGFDKTKGAAHKIKKLLNYPIDISISPSEESLIIEVEKIVPEPKVEFPFMSNEMDGF